MTKHFSIFLIVSFLTIQTLSVLHMAEHHFEKHEHNGHICHIYLHGKHTKYNLAAADISLQIPVYLSFRITFPDDHFINSQRHGIASPRAPPLFS